MTCLEIIFAILGIIVAIVVPIGIAVYQQKYQQSSKATSVISTPNEQIDIDAKRFIQRYRVEEDNHNAEIYLLPLCVSAYKYDSTRSYRRQIYKEFCILSEEVQNRILELCELDLKSQKYPNYFEAMLNIVTGVIRKEYPHDRNIFYEGGKYFERAITSHGNEEKPNIECSAYKDQKDFEFSPYGAFFQSKILMPYDSHIQNMMRFHKEESPVEQLMYESTNMGVPVETDEIVMSYLCCKIAEQAILCRSISDEERERINEKQLGYVEDFQGEWYMEDIFLLALHTIENYSKGE